MHCAVLFEAAPSPSVPPAAASTDRVSAPTEIPVNLASPGPAAPSTSQSSSSRLLSLESDSKSGEISSCKHAGGIVKLTGAAARLNKTYQFFKDGIEARADEFKITRYSAFTNLVRVLGISAC